MARWDLVLRRATILTPSSLEQMWTPARLANGQPARVFDQLYGLGWNQGDVAGHRTVGHGGASGTYFLRFMVRPLSVVVITNRGVNGRNPMMLAESVAGTLYPELKPPQLATPGADPDPALTTKVSQLVADLVAKREPAVATVAYRTWYNTTPQAWRNLVGNALGRAGPPKYVMTTAVGGKSLWGMEPIERLAYYVLPTGNVTPRLTIGVTKVGEIARVDFSPR
jgi:hypothetical protein